MSNTSNMRHISLLNPSAQRCANEIMKWAEDFLIPEHKEIKRPVGSQAICPFVAASIEQDSFYMVFHPEVTGADYSQVEEILNYYIEVFVKSPPYDEHGALKALLVVFNKMESGATQVLDMVAGNLKDEFVSRYLMVAPFYPKCKQWSVYNPALYTSRSPYPLIAIRNMAIHDILFLHEQKNWFDSYNRKFGDRFKEPSTIEDFNRHLLMKYDEAKRKFSR